MGLEWTISYVVLWVLVVCIAALLVILARQIGVLHMRLLPMGARMINAGPEIGSVAPVLRVPGDHQKGIVLGNGRRTLIVFVSPNCSSCAGLAPAIRAVANSERSALEVILISLTDDQLEMDRFAQRFKLSATRHFASFAVAMEYSVMTAPYAVLVDESGVVVAKGITNHREHLDSLLEAADRGHPSMESLVGMRSPGGN